MIRAHIQNPLRLLSLAVLVLLLTLGIFAHKAFAITRTWDGGGADSNWSTCANWSTDTCPVAGDTVTFDATSTKNSTVDPAFNATETIVTININSGYTGTITLATSLHVTTSFVQHAGTFSASSQLLDLNGTFTLDGGTFTASSTSTTLAGNMTISGSPTFNPNAGTFTFDSASGATLSCNNVTFNAVTFAHTASTKTVNSNCNLPLGASPTLGSGTAGVTLNGTLSGSGTLTAPGAFGINATGVLSGFPGIVANGTFTQTGGTQNFGSYTTFDMNSTFTLSTSGVFTAPSGVASFAANFTLNAGTTFNANGGTVTFDSVNGGTLACNNAVFNLVVFAQSSTGSRVVGSNCSLPLGANPTIGAVGDPNPDLTLNGTLTGTGTLKMGAANAGNALTLNSTAVLSGFSGLNGGTLTTTGATVNFGAYTTFALSGNYGQAGGTVTLPSGVIFPGTFTVNTAGTVNAPSGTATFNNNFTLATGTTFNANGGTVTFGSAASATLACGNATFNLVTFTHTVTTKTVGSDCTLPLGANPTVGAGSDANARLALNGTLTGTGTLKIASASLNNVFTLGSTAALSGFSGLSAGALTVTGATVNFGSMTSFALSGAYAQAGGTITVPSGADFNNTFAVTSSGVFNAPSGTATFASTFTLATGTTFNANSGTITFDGNATATLACGNATFSLVTFAHIGNSTKTVGSDCTLPLGNNPTVGGDLNADLTLNGTLTGTGTLTIGTTNANNLLTLNSTAVLSGFSSFNFGSLTTTNLTANFATLSSFVINGSYVQTGGAITPPNNAAFNGFFTLSSAGVFNAPTVISFATNFTLNTGTTFNANGGTITFNGLSGGATLSCNNTTFSHVVINTGGSIIINANCTLPVDATNVVIGNYLTLFGTIVNSGGAGKITTAGCVFLNSGGQLQGFTSLNVGGCLNLNSGSWDFGNYTSLIVGGDFNQLGNPFIAPSGTMEVHRNFATGTGFNANGGTVNLAGALTDPYVGIGCAGAALNRVNVNYTYSAYPVNIEAGCNLPLGNNPTINASLNLVGTLSGTGTLTSTVGAMTLGKDFFGNTGNPLLSGFTRLVAHDLVVDTGTVNLGSFNTLDVNNDFTVQNNATFTATSATMTVGHNFSILDTSTFIPNGGTVLLDGSDQTVTGAPFNNLTKTVATAATLTLAAGSATTVTGTLTLQGTASQPLSLVSSNPGTTWQVNSQGTADVCFVNVTDSSNSGVPIIAYNSTSNSANTGWIFSSRSCIPPIIIPPASGGSDTGNTAIPLPVSSLPIRSRIVIQAPAAVSEDTTTPAPSISSEPEPTRDSHKPATNATGKDKFAATKPNKGSVFVVGMAIVACLVLGWFVVVFVKRRHQRD